MTNEDLKVGNYIRIKRKEDLIKYYCDDRFINDAVKNGWCDKYFKITRLVRYAGYFNTAETLDWTLAPGSYYEDDFRYKEYERFLKLKKVYEEKK